MEKIRFSIVIPAHNEEALIGTTIQKLKELDYPKDKYEVIVAENGSTDKTFQIAKQFKSKLIHPYSMKARGISLAKNFGESKAKKDSEWIIFLDADTFLEKDFLDELNYYLQMHKSDNLSIGTTRLIPLEGGMSNRFWFWVYDLLHKYKERSASIQIARKDLFDKIKYDENLKILEDIKLIQDLTKLGKFFYLDTKNVRASARRYNKVGGLRLTFQWTLAFFVPYKLRTKMDYEIVRSDKVSVKNSK